MWYTIKGFMHNNTTFTWLHSSEIYYEITIVFKAIAMNTNMIKWTIMMENDSIATITINQLPIYWLENYMCCKYSQRICRYVSFVFEIHVLEGKENVNKDLKYVGRRREKGKERKIRKIRRESISTYLQAFYSYLRF